MRTWEKGNTRQTFSSLKCRAVTNMRSRSASEFEVRKFRDQAKHTRCERDVIGGAIYIYVLVFLLLLPSSSPKTNK